MVTLLIGKAVYCAYGSMKPQISAGTEGSEYGVSEVVGEVAGV